MARLATKDKILNQCISQLKAIGCDFIVKDYCDDDNIWTNGEMQLAEAKPKKKVNKKRWIEQRAINVPIVEAMKVGDVHVFELPQGEDINAFRSLICNIARVTFGGDQEDPHYTSCSNKENTQIELLRIV